MNGRRDLNERRSREFTEKRALLALIIMMTVNSSHTLSYFTPDEGEQISGQIQLILLVCSCFIVCLCSTFYCPSTSDMLVLFLS